MKVVVILQATLPQPEGRIAIYCAGRIALHTSAIRNLEVHEMYQPCARSIREICLVQVA